jgi:CheY-like chemotaxis protein
VETAEVGVLYYDPNPTTTKLAVAGLRLAGYKVFACDDRDEAVQLCSTHGPAGDGQIRAIMLDTAADAGGAASVLRALVQLPGASELPGILIVSKSAPRPIPGAEALPTLVRPFSTPALVKIVREALDETKPHAARAQAPLDATAQRLKSLLEQHLGGHAIGEAEVRRIASALRLEAGELVDTSLRGVLGPTKLEAVLEMLANAGGSGVLTVQRDGALGRLHLDQARIRLAEVKGTDEDLKLGRFVVEAGFMRDEELEAFVVGKDPEGRPLGQRLVDGGFLSGSELAQVLVAQAREVTCHMLGWTTGEFWFAPTESLHPLAALAATQSKSELLVAEALLDGLRRLQESATMGPHMARVDDIYVRIDEQIQHIGKNALTRDELAVLELLNGRNSVKDIARKTRTGTFGVALVLYRLTKANLARRRVMPVVV